MTATLMSDLSITVSQRRWACVLDPTLALSEYGLPLVKQLGEFMELWIVREFWHILDNPHFYLQQPLQRLGLHNSALSPDPSNGVSQQIVRSLHAWEQLRTSSDRHTWKIYFLADVLGESCVPPGADTDLIWRWESLAQSLDQQIQNQPDAILAFRDLAALAAARPACILTHRSTAEAAQNLPPGICAVFEQCGIPCHEVTATDAIAAIERDHFRNLFIHAGLAKYLWAGFCPIVLHLVVPAATSLSVQPNWADSYAFSESEEFSDFPDILNNLWEGVQGFWYAI